MTLSGGWTTAGGLASARWFLPTNAVTLGNGKVLIAGGMNSGSGALSDADLYEFDGAAGIWSATAPMLASRHAHSLTRLADGRVLAPGGGTNPTSYPEVGLDTSELYDPNTDPPSWSMTGAMRQGRLGHAATLLADGGVLVAGGLTVRSSAGSDPPGSERALRSAELYDPESGRWTPTGAMTDARWGTRAVRLHDGTVLVVGGVVPVGQGPEVGLAYCELYDPVTGTWTPTGSMRSNRMGHDVALLGDGRVLVTGGSPGYLDDISSPSFTSAELYDPRTGAWTPASDMHVGRWEHRALTLPSGQVLVVGGWDYSLEIGTDLDTAEVYDPSNDTWSMTGRLAIGRRDFVAAPVRDGRVLVAGGIAGTTTEGHLVTSTAELFTLRPNG